MEQSEGDPGRQLEVLWRAKWLIVSSSLLCAAVAAVVAFVLPKQYEGSVQLATVSAPSSNGALGSMPTELGGLAALAGISVGGDSSKNESIAVLQSDALTEAYIDKNNLLPILYDKEWDSGTKAWKKDARIPTLWRANRFFSRSVRKITPNAKSGLVTLTVTWTDPDLAAGWANGMVKMANEYLRDKAIQTSERHIAYLTSEAAKTTIVEARTAIFTILANEINKQMLARGSEEYAFKIIDPATSPELASAPKKPLWILGGAGVGLLFSILFVTVRSNHGVSTAASQNR